ncbi:hypothetical protein [Mycolicibacterium sp.]|uniref:hypothetical protein n=1 Tax=Mycolicibacterium sp. TaxID=2320850 RepID=UPI0037C75772
MSTPAKKAAPRKAARKAAPRKAEAAAAPLPADAKLDEAPAAAGASLYPKGIELFEWTSPTNGIKIVFPKITTRQPDRVFFWKLYQLEPVFQGFEWMAEYQVPMPVQALAISLPDVEYQMLFDAWFAESGMNAGE